MLIDAGIDAGKFLYGLFPSFPFQRFIRHSAEFLCRRIFQYLKEPISNLLFCLLR